MGTDKITSRTVRVKLRHGGTHNARTRDDVGMLDSLRRYRTPGDAGPLHIHTMRDRHVRQRRKDG
jgi:hypothetical protein